MKLARRVTELAESATLAVAARASKLRSEGIDVVSFAAGEPDFDTPAHVVQAGIAALEAGQTRYPKPASGIAAAKQAVCDKLARENGLTYTPDQVIITVTKASDRPLQVDVLPRWGIDNGRSCA